jgi:2-polyprenyl-6-methoxyphenol hydroxylase-like FAD-dependent oxidoreductase
MTGRRLAAVIGGSLAGQLAAAALSRAGFEVVILDRDELPDEAAPRKGLPQARHIHVLLVGGQRAMETLLPRLSARLASAGAQVLDITRDVAVHTLCGWHRRHSSGLDSYFLSRDLLDLEVRQAVAALPGVRTLCEYEVIGLVGDLNAVRGVRCRRRGADKDEMTLDADLVVDASGRDSKAPDWLAALGAGAVREQVVEPFLGYSSRLYRMPPGFDAPWKAMIVRSRASVTRGAAIVPIEGGRWLATLAGYSRDWPPIDDDGFLGFADSIGVPQLAQALRAAEPLTPAAGYRRTANRWRRFDEMQHWPQRFIVAGDAVCAFNPYYGQGMSVAALEALAFSDLLSRHADAEDLSALFQQRLARIIAHPWLMATTEECRYPETQGAARGLKTSLNLWFTDRLLLRASHDAEVRTTFMSVAQLVKPSSALLKPRVLFPVLFAPSPRHAVPPPAAAVVSASSQPRL